MQKGLNLTEAVVLQNISKSYPTTPNKRALENINFSVFEGEFFCLIGPSGCGKSTLLRIIAGIDTPSQGQIHSLGTTSMVFQSGALLPWLNVFDNTAFGLKMLQKDQKEIAQKSAKYLEMVNLSGFDKKYPRELSGGQKQRVGIARALAVEPKILLLDEPFSALDALTTKQLHADLLKIWNETKITIIMVSHLLEEAIVLAQRIGVMNQGQIKGIISVDLPRPRKTKSDQFYHLEDKLYRLIK